MLQPVSKRLTMTGMKPVSNYGQLVPTIYLATPPLPFKGVKSATTSIIRGVGNGSVTITAKPKSPSKYKKGASWTGNRVNSSTEGKAVSNTNSKTKVNRRRKKGIPGIIKNKKK